MFYYKPIRYSKFHLLSGTSSPWALTFSWQHTTYKPNKLGQTEAIFGLLSEFTNRSVHATLQVSMCSGWFVSRWLTHTHSDNLWPAILLTQPAELKVVIQATIIRYELDVGCVSYWTLSYWIVPSCWVTQRSRRYVSCNVMQMQIYKANKKQTVTRRRFIRNKQTKEKEKKNKLKKRLNNILQHCYTFIMTVYRRWK